MIDDILVIREYKPEIDEKFVCSSWIKACRCRNYTYSKVQDDVFFCNYHDFMNTIIGISKILVVSNKDDENQLYGYIVCQPDCLHFCYVKNNFRKFGIGKKLIDAAGMINKIQYSNHTPSSKFITRYFDRAIYNPFRMFIYGTIPSVKSRTPERSSSERQDRSDEAKKQHVRTGFRHAVY